MARRTNKTDHVLNLLSTGNKKQETDAESGEKAAPPVSLNKGREEQKEKKEQKETKEQSEHEEPQAGTTAGKESGVSVVHMSADGENPIANAVKNSLEEELGSYLGESEEVQLEEKKQMEQEIPETEIEREPVAEEEPAAPESVAVSEEETLQPEHEAEQPTPDVEPEQTVSAEQEGAQPEVTPEPEQSVPEPEQPQEEPQQEENAQEVHEQPAETPEQQEAKVRKMTTDEIEAEQSSFGMLNVMERLVRDKAEIYMEQFDTCLCRRCREDIIALSLTHLPAKYVVADKNALSPLLSFYEKRYAGQVTVELTKACMRIKEHPHH